MRRTFRSWPSFSYSNSSAHSRVPSGLRRLKKDIEIIVHRSPAPGLHRRTPRPRFTWFDRAFVADSQVGQIRESRSGPE